MSPAHPGINVVTGFLVALEIGDYIERTQQIRANRLPGKK